MNYDSLVAQIQATTKRDDTFFTNQIPNFISRAMNRLDLELENIGFQKVVTGNLTTNSFLPKPADWKQTISLSISINGSMRPLLLRDIEFCQAYNPTQALGIPKFYADYSSPVAVISTGQFLISPRPQAAYPYILIYEGIPLFNPANQTTFITDRYEVCLYQACMIEVWDFLQQNERLSIAQNLYQEAKGKVNEQTKDRYIDRVSKRDIE